MLLFIKLSSYSALGGSPLRQTILAVDDNEAHRYAIARTLEKAGFTAIQAGTGTDALALARDCRPDVILLDVYLPDVNGLDLCRSLKADAMTSHIPVVIHTASADGSAAAISAQMGASAFLTFPIEPDHLLNVLMGCLARAGDAPESDSVS